MGMSEETWAVVMAFVYALVVLGAIMLLIGSGVKL
jgi:hypothetical protein